MKLRVTTFNVENLFNRYAFLNEPWANRSYEKFIQAIGVVSIAGRQGDLVPEPTTIIQRNNTALAIEDAAPDILAVQEVENIETLRIFNDEFLSNYFGDIYLLEGNDPRGIDVGFMVRAKLEAKVTAIRSHMNEGVDGKAVVRKSAPNFGYVAENALFSRDCLEVDVDVAGKKLTFLVNHLKAQDQTSKSKERRAMQAKRVAEIVSQVSAAGRFPIVLGDCNAPPNDGSLDALLAHPDLKDPFPAGTWTHFYEAGREVSRLDYVLPHKSLHVEGTEIVKKGLSTKCKVYNGPRYPTIGPVHTEASDHCPTSIIVDL